MHIPAETRHANTMAEALHRREGTPAGEDAWARAWAPYDEPTYAQVLAHLSPADVVLDIGAGDLRLARRMAVRVRRVYAVEVQAQVVAQGLRQGPLPRNLHVIAGDARTLPVPPGVTVGVLLMRHCPDVGVYVEMLTRAGAARLITNARWGLGVEVVDLEAPRVPFAAVAMGWYACRCGATGFIPGPPERLTPALLDRIYEVYDCPACAAEGDRRAGTTYQGWPGARVSSDGVTATLPAP